MDDFIDFTIVYPKNNEDVAVALRKQLRRLGLSGDLYPSLSVSDATALTDDRVLSAFFIISKQPLDDDYENAKNAVRDDDSTFPVWLTPGKRELINNPKTRSSFVRFNSLGGITASKAGLSDVDFVSSDAFKTHLEENIKIKELIKEQKNKIKRDRERTKRIPIFVDATPSPETSKGFRDLLGHEEYAKKMAEVLIMNKAFKPPATIGVFAPWGSGKSRFINLIKNQCNIEESFQPRIAEEKVSCCFNGDSDRSCKWWLKLLMWILVVLLCTLSLIGSVIYLSVAPELQKNNQTVNASSSEETQEEEPDYWYYPATGAVMLVAVLLMTSCCQRKVCRDWWNILGENCCLSCCCCKRTDYDLVANETQAHMSCCSVHSCGVTWCPHTKAFCYMAFFDPAYIKDEEGSEEKRYKAKPTGDIKIITVDFNAWEYSGCDHLWAGIVSTLGNRIEDYFGKWKVRLCRILLKHLEEKNNDKSLPSSSRSVKCCYMRHKIYMMLLMLIAILALATTVVTVLATRYDEAIKHSRIWISISAMIGALIVLATAFGFVTSKLLKSTESLVNQISSDMNGENFSQELGFMHRIKNEVCHITQIVHFMCRLYGVKFRVLLTIDDLDRCQTNRIMGVLEAVSLLLEPEGEKESPFISILAIDPRVILGAIERHYDPDVRKDYTHANVNGYEYLKKIIHMPFCLPLPKTDEKMEYINKLLNTGKKKKDSIQQSRNLTDEILPSDLDETDAPVLIEHSAAYQRLVKNCAELRLKICSQGSYQEDSSFFRTVSDALRIASCNSFTYSPTVLLRRTADDMATNPVIKAKYSSSNWARYCQDIKNGKRPVDSLVIEATAQFLKTDFRVITSSDKPGAVVRVITGNGDKSRKPLLIGEIDSTHYRCLIPEGDEEIDLTQNITFIAEDLNSAELVDACTFRTAYRRLSNSCSQYGLRFSGTAGKRNCFFTAVVSQLGIHSAEDLRSQVLNFMTVQQSIKSDYLKDNPTEDWVSYCKQVKNDPQVLDKYVLKSIAYFFKRNLNIMKGTEDCHMEGITNQVQMISCDDESKLKPLLLGEICECLTDKDRANDIAVQTPAVYNSSEAPTNSDAVNTDAKSYKVLSDECSTLGLKIVAKSPGSRLCVYQVVCQQMGLSEPEVLRNNVIEFMRENPEIEDKYRLENQRRSWKSHCEAMGNNKQCIDKYLIESTALFLSRNIKLFTAVISKKAKHRDPFEWITGDKNCILKPLLLGRVTENHFESLIVISEYSTANDLKKATSSGAKLPLEKKNNSKNTNSQTLNNTDSQTVQSKTLCCVSYQHKETTPPDLKTQQRSSSKTDLIPCCCLSNGDDTSKDIDRNITKDDAAPGAERAEEDTRCCYLPVPKQPHSQADKTGQLDEVDNSGEKQQDSRKVQENESHSPEQISGIPHSRQQRASQDELMTFVSNSLQEDELLKLMHGNPRSLKRICNIMLLALSVCKDENITTEEAFQLLLIVIMVEQWPFRTSFLRQFHMNDVQKKEAESMKYARNIGDIEIRKIKKEENLDVLSTKELSEVWKNNKHRIREVDSWKKFITYDWDPELFQVFLSTYSLRFKHLNKYIEYAVNHDTNIESIVEQGLAQLDDEKCSIEMTRQRLRRLESQISEQDEPEATA